MDRKVVGAISFLVLLVLYVTVLMLVAPILPILCLAGLVMWVVVRRPLTSPGRVEGDLRLFARGLGEAVEGLLRTLIRPLCDDYYAPPPNRIDQL